MLKYLLKCIECGNFRVVTVPEGFYYKMFRGKLTLYDNTGKRSIQTVCRKCGKRNYKLVR